MQTAYDVLSAMPYLTVTLPASSRRRMSSASLITTRCLVPNVTNAVELLLSQIGSEEQGNKSTTWPVLPVILVKDNYLQAKSLACSTVEFFARLTIWR